jgi:diguanylate cyclase (GGDEF)-like protein
MNRPDASTISIIAITNKSQKKLSSQMQAGINTILTTPMDNNQVSIKLLKCLHQSSKLRIEMLKNALDCVNKDALTGVNNRMAFENFEAKITHKIVTNKISSFSIILFDINNLKNTNDLLGHDAGDQLIIDGCKIICNTFKHSPVFRLGGDEFVAFLQGEDYNNRAELLSGFQKKMNKEYFISGAVSIASGMSDFIPQKDINVLDVFKRADEAMYKTKAKMKKQRV